LPGRDQPRAGVDVFGRARGVRAPTLFLWAKRGNFSRATYEKLAASMRAGRVEDVEAGHLVPLERPELVVGAVERDLLLDPGPGP
jgi:pimeloyl-ACP methyl ester carboxylesterase